MQARFTGQATMVSNTPSDQTSRTDDLSAIAFEVTEDGLWDVDFPTGNLFVNRPWLAMLGYEEHEFTGHISFWEPLCHPDDIPEVQNLVKFLREGTISAYRHEHRLRHRDGHYIWVLGRGKVVAHDSEGNALRGIGTIVDISERKKAQEALRLSEQTLRETVDSVALGMWDLDLLTGQCHHDAACFQILGYQPGEAPDTMEFWDRTIYPDDKAAAVSALLHYLSDPAHHLYSIHYRVVKRDGETVWIGMTGNVTEWDTSGKPLRMRGILRDITEPKRLETALKASEARFRLLINSMHDGVVMQNQNGEIVISNPRAEEVLGLSADQMAGRLSVDPCWRAIHEDGTDFPGETHPGMVALQTGKPIWDSVMGVHKPDGSLVWININATPLFTEGDSKPYAVVATFAEITERVRMERELQQSHALLEERVQERTTKLQLAMEEAARANEAKTRFLSRMSHELRTPLNSILGFGQILQRQALTPRQQESVEYILAGGYHLLELVNEVLDITRVESGQDELVLESLALGEITMQAWDLVRALAEEQDIHFSESLSSSGDHRVLADRRRLKQVLQNLFTNAIKYNHHGGRVHVSCEAQANGTVCIGITDSGRGISREHQKRLFTPFDRLSAEDSNIEGTGLGLVLSRELLKTMNGDLLVESVLGQGSTFTLVLPLASSV